MYKPESAQAIANKYQIYLAFVDIHHQFLSFFWSFCMEFLWDDKVDPFFLRQSFPTNTLLALVYNCDAKQLTDWLNPFCSHYPWAIAPPETTCDGEYILCTLTIEDNYVDEQLFLHLLVELSKRNQCFIHVVSSHEGEILLVDAHESLDSVLKNPEWAYNRPWIHAGSVMVVNSHGIEEHLPLARAVEQLKNKDYEPHSSITDALNKSLQAYSSYNLDNLFDIQLVLPPQIAHLLASNPWLISRAYNISHKKIDGFENIAHMMGGDATPGKYAIQAKDAALVQLMHRHYAPNQDFTQFATILFCGGLDKVYRADLQATRKENSRSVLQDVLIEQGRIPDKIEPNHANLEQLLAADVDSTREKTEMEDFNNIISQVKVLLEDPVDIEDEWTDDSSDDIQEAKDELEAILDSEFKDFADFLVEARESNTVYNDDSDYQDDEPLADLNFDEYNNIKKRMENMDLAIDSGDQIIDVDSEEDVDPYDEPLDVRKEMEEYLNKHRNR